MKSSSQPHRFFHLLNSKLHPSWVLISFCVGILVACILAIIFSNSISDLLFCLPSQPYWILLPIILLAIAFFTHRKWAILLAIVAGMMVIAIRILPDLSGQALLKQLSGHDVTLSGKILKDPVESTTSTGRFNLDLVDANILTDERAPPRSVSAHIFVQVSGAELERSNYITVTGKLNSGFGNYAASIIQADIKEIMKPEPGDIFLKIRDNFAERIKDYIPMPQAGLGIGYLLGQKTGVDQAIQKALRTVGLTHIIVASGAHLSTLTGFSRKLFGKISRFTSLIAALVLMLVFIGITGLSASMLRASLVTSISLISWYFGRNIQAWRIILLAATATLIYNPFYLTDMSWQLSFASFAGIMIIAPFITRCLYGKTRKPGILISSIISSLAASLLCTPIILYFFGQISLISVVANMLILPTISFAMGLTFLTGFSAYFLPPLANVFGHLATLLLDYQISVANFFASSKVFLIETETENPLIFLWYIPVGLLAFIVILRSCLRKCRSVCYAENKLRELPDNLPGS